MAYCFPEIVKLSIVDMHSVAECVVVLMFSFVSSCWSLVAVSEIQSQYCAWYRYVNF